MSMMAVTRGGSDAWALRPEVVSALRAGDDTAVPPMTLEYAPTLACSANCPGCSYRSARHASWEGLVDIAPPDDIRSASFAGAMRVLEAARRMGVTGCIWTGGGEPLVWPPLIDAMRAAAGFGMVGCLYTNGFRLGHDAEVSDSLLHPESGLVFVRVSINAVTPAAFRRHWGIRDASAVEQQRVGLANLFAARRRLSGLYERLGRTLPGIQVSTIVDRTTIDDLPTICATVADVRRRFAAGSEPGDVFVVRPSTRHAASQYGAHDHEDSTVREIIAVCGDHGPGRRALEEAGWTVALGFGLAELEAGRFARYEDVVRAQYVGRDCRSSGLFLTVGPDGVLYPCTELNCNVRWAFGSLREQSLEEIWHGAQRRSVLARLHSCRWGPTICQPFTRMNRLDGIARALRCGVLDEGEVERIRERARHSSPLLLS